MKDLSNEAPKLTSALKLLPIVAELHAELEGRKPNKVDPSDVDVWFHARRLVRQSRAEFAVAGDVAALEQAGVDELVERARALSGGAAARATRGAGKAVVAHGRRVAPGAK